MEIDASVFLRIRIVTIKVDPRKKISSVRH